MNKAIVTAKPGESIITIERTFAASKAKLFAAMTTKSKLEKWWLGPGHNVRIDQLDVRDGGTWKFVQTAGDHEFAFHGSYHEVGPDRVVQTMEFSGLPERGHVAMERMELIAIDANTTKLRVTSAFFSVADRDGMVQSGMEDGMNQSYDRLDAVLKEA